MSTCSGVEIEQNKYFGRISTIMRLVTRKDGDLSSYFVTINESEGGFNDSSLKQLLINNHSDDNKGVIGGHLPLEYNFGFCRSFKRITKSLGFELDPRTSNRKEDILLTTLGANDVKVTIKRISLYIPSLVHNAETQVFFNEAITKSFTLSYESWTTDRKPVNAAREFQVDISSASNINSPLCLIAVHQQTQRDNPARPLGQYKDAIFDHVEVRKYYSGVDGVRNPKNPAMVIYEENKYLDQYRDIKLFYKDYVGESMLSPIITYDRMKDFYPFQIIDLRFQVDPISPNKIRIFEEYNDNPADTVMYIILMKHRETKMISVGNKVISVEVV